MKFLRFGSISPIPTDDHSEKGTIRKLFSQLIREILSAIVVHSSDDKGCFVLKAFDQRSLTLTTLDNILLVHMTSSTIGTTQCKPRAQL